VAARLVGGAVQVPPDGQPVVFLADAARSADVDNPKGYFEHERIKDLEKETDKSYLREGRGKALKVISFLIQHLPDENDYRVIFMRRDLDEVLSSQDKMIQRLGAADAAADREAMKEAYRNDIVRTRLLCRKRPNFGRWKMGSSLRPCRAWSRSNAMCSSSVGTCALAGGCPWERRKR